MDIETKKITVRQDNANDKSAVLFEADGISGKGNVKIGGFTVDSNRLYAGTPGTDNGIELASTGTNGASLKVGSNFSVDSTGAIKSTSGTVGKLAINDNGLSYGDIFKIDPTVSN